MLVCRSLPLLLVSLFCLAPAFVKGLSSPGASNAAGQGRVLEGLNVSSRILDRDVNYAVYLPPDYQASTRRYPVVYLLHGFTDDESAWIQFGEANLAADRAIADRSLPPMIIVMPDGGVTWYVNDHRDEIRFEDMFVREFIPHIDAAFRTRPSREFRGVSGLSMGGWGTLMFAFRHPDLFSSCAAFSAAVFTDEGFAAMEPPLYENMMAPVFGPGLSGKARLTPHFRKYNPLDLARTLPAESLKKARYYIDCGDDDFLINGNMALHSLLLERGIPHEFRVRNGGHTWAYWRTGISDGLKFIGESFHR
ncbi:MAG: alpha/beta hydrolase family protein [Acidobacteriota bacterium]|nr:alpha/beta hydrolase family protein [Acidobacteriota bacterium]